MFLSRPARTHAESLGRNAPSQVGGLALEEETVVEAVKLLESSERLTRQDGLRGPLDPGGCRRHRVSDHRHLPSSAQLCVSMSARRCMKKRLRDVQPHSREHKPDAPRERASSCGARRPRCRVPRRRSRARVEPAEVRAAPIDASGVQHHHERRSGPAAKMPNCSRREAVVGRRVAIETRYRPPSRQERSVHAFPTTTTLSDGLSP